MSGPVNSFTMKAGMMVSHLMFNAVSWTGIIPKHKTVCNVIIFNTVLHTSSGYSHTSNWPLLTSFISRIWTNDELVRVPYQPIFQILYLQVFIWRHWSFHDDNKYYDKLIIIALFCASFFRKQGLDKDTWISSWVREFETSLSWEQR